MMLLLHCIETDKHVGATVCKMMTEPKKLWIVGMMELGKWIDSWQVIELIKVRLKWYVVGSCHLSMQGL